MEPWYRRPDLVQLFDALEARSAKARIVGGAVRDSLLDRPIGDIDLAIDVPPYETLKLLREADIQAIPTGIDHGTITAVIHKVPYQITTLRTDDQTHGRHADVSFIDSWEEDAKRRDFTINALYMDREGVIDDPCGGLEDLKVGRVRFIGDAHARIKEDYLRILRFFRFSGAFSNGDFDPEGLVACHAHSDSLQTLSKERITQELLKILALPQASRTIAQMEPEMTVLFGGVPNIEALRSLEEREAQMAFPPSALRRLVSLGYKHHPWLALSNVQRDQITFLIQHKSGLGDIPLYRWLYEWGSEYILDLVVLSGETHLIPQIQSWVRPTFPLTGRDLIERGVKPGPQMGEILKTVEDWWVDNQCLPTREACIGQLERLVGNQ